LNNHQAALDAFQAIAAKYPSSNLASAALFEQGGVYAQQGKPTEALASFGKIQEQYPKSDEAAEASYQQGLELKSTNQADDAVRKFEATITQYPKSAASDRSRVALGWMNQSVENYTRALEYFKAVATNRTDELGAEAQYALGVTQQSAKNYSEAILSYLRVKYVFPSSEDWITKSYFNLGDCYEKTNQKQKAKDAYNFVIKQGGELAAEAEQRLRKLEQL
jgi:TolA-binding protein